MDVLKEAEKAIMECVWRTNVEGIPICGGVLFPCIATIEKGECDTLRKLMERIYTLDEEGEADE